MAERGDRRDPFIYTPLTQALPTNPARTWPFTLDPFQALSIAAIERNESVLVSAHTSAGKTVVAEYAIAQCLRKGQRVVYTSPIKALSNQKYRELLAEFGDVGLMTGDVTLSPNASCLVMTTEILRSMLYRGSELMRQIGWVVFDEVHYMRDKARGVVWEETLILLPHDVRYVFLSATIPNAMQFAEWICDIHRQPCHIVYTDYRPTPLQHYLFPQGGDGIHLVVDERSNFREDNFQKAISQLGAGANSKESAEEPGRRVNTKTGKTDKKTSREKQGKDLYKIIRMLMLKQYHPVIVFSFSKKECESNALAISKLDFNDASERDIIADIYSKAIAGLSEEDQRLPQIEHMLPLLKRGIGVHHSGLLPILKEVIEILFQEGLLKVLFATETFSIGLNMPAKTVVFTSVQKWDGVQSRWLGGGEYIQMSGRAGRRGLDDRGIVVLMIDEKMEPDVAKSMVKGQSDALNSAFHLTYTMILNLMRVEDVQPEFVLKQSFFQFQNTSRIPVLKARLAELDQAAEQHPFRQLTMPEPADAGDASIPVVMDVPAQVEDFVTLQHQITAYEGRCRALVMTPEIAVPFLMSGRLARVKDTELDYGWGVVAQYHRKRTQLPLVSVHLAPKERISHVVDVLVWVPQASVDPAAATHPDATIQDGRALHMVAVELAHLTALSSVRVNMPAAAQLDSASGLAKPAKSLREAPYHDVDDPVPVLDPVEHMKVQDPAYPETLMRLNVLRRRRAQHPFMTLFTPAFRLQCLREYQAFQSLQGRIREVEKEIVATESILQLDELKARRRVLRRLGYTSAADIIDIKGRVACEISAGDELMLTELMFNGVFNDLTPAECVALLSVFCWDEKSNATQKGGQVKTRENLMKPFHVVQETARKIAKVAIEARMQGMDEEKYVESFNPELMEVVYAWCQGTRFSLICKMTDAFEGSIIRAMRRIEELLRQMGTAAKSIGNDALEAKFADGSVKLKRDIVFAASLYL
ncbi:hypothetical protein CXG81DRAFT_9419 [Caulochytrium protostelioides]|uniref:Antiviral helicase n=1 Tax=Caulochytrium protostelioides TaxID=1555241 RepID=A0A4P9XEG9_9FUNG|nr:hypothetical protein CXG81DRAFT_9419 [Caulochytrium protostelioides]|eukprot:RKP03550.1 hypothetical protein CXG81DRAFT_9419 [Caulochytrium protostelioides]